MISLEKRAMLIGVSVLALSGAISAPAFAAADDQSQVVQEVIVTANKRSESVLKVPAAISVIAGGDLKTAGVNTVTDLQNIVPGLSMSIGQDGVNIGIRGVTASDTSSKGEQDISFNVDGVYVGRGNARTSAFFDLERVEVLSGPQGTLYGRSSTGGAINLITNKPRLGETSGYANFEYGNYDAQRIEAAVNLPLGEVLALRIAGAANRRDGYAKPQSYSATIGGTTYNFSAATQPARNDQSDQTARVSLLYQPTDRVTGRLTATVGRQTGEGGAAQVEDFLKNGSGEDRYRILASPVPSYQDNTSTSFDGSLNARFGDNTQLDVLASHQLFRLHQQRALSNSVLWNNGLLQLIRQRTRTATSAFEARISNVETRSIDYVAGVNYYKEDIYENGHLWNAPPATASDTTTWQNFFGPINNTYHESYGAFAQGTWHLNDQWSFIAGGRYTFDKVEREGTLTLPFFSCTYPNDCGGVPNNGGSTDKKPTWKLGANYQFDASNLLFASIATGFKGGGFNDYDPKTNGPGQYAPASLTSYEIGYKGRPMASLVLTSDLYYYDYTHNQVNGTIAFPATGQNAPYTVTTPTIVYGLENQFTYWPRPGTTITGGLTFMHSEYKNFLAGGIYGDQVSWAGKSLDQTPKMEAMLGLDQTFAISSGELKFHGLIKYNDGYWLSDIGNAVRYWQPSFTRTNLSLAYEPKDSAFSLQVFVENLEDSVQRTSVPGNYVGSYGGVGGQTQVGGVPVYPMPGNGVIPTQPANYMTFSTAPPRFYGMRLSVKF